MVLLPSIFYQLLALGSPPATSGPTAVDSDISDPRQVWALAMGQTLGILFIALLCRQRFMDGLSGWGLTLDRAGARCVQALAGYVAIWPACFALLYLTVFLIRLGQPDFKPPEHSAILTLLSHGTRLSVIVMTVLSTVVLAPMLEELFFRGLVQPALARWSGRPWISIFVAGAAIGIYHYPLVHTIPALTVLAAFLGFLYARSRSLTLVISSRRIQRKDASLARLRGHLGRLH